MKLSIHGKMRMRERTNLNHQERRNLFRNALDNGKSIQEIKDDKVREYIQNRCYNCKIKLYQDYLFIYSKNSKRLYTMYKLPEELLGREKYRG